MAGSKWTEEEKEIIKNNKHLNSTELMQKLPERSRVAIEQMSRKLNGTSNRTFKKGWDKPSKELAWLLGFIAADGGLGSNGYALTVSQKGDNMIVLKEFKRIIEKKVGLPCKIKQINIDGEYYRAWVCHKDIGDLCPKKGSDWRGFVEEFPWVLEDKYFWRFFGGVYDGDGSLSRKFKDSSKGIWYELSIAVSSDKTQKMIKEEFSKKGFDFRMEDKMVVLRGGQDKVDEFLNKIECKIGYKKDKSKLREGVQFISRKNAVNFLDVFHYLDGVPIGKYVGYVEEGDLISVAVFGSTQANVIEGDYEVRELRRFAVSDYDGFSSEILSKIVSHYLEKYPEVDIIVSFADEEEGHDGTLYKAMSWDYLGSTGEEIKIYGPNGELISTRHGAKQLRKKNIDPKECEVSISAGKHKYVYICAKQKSRRKDIRSLLKL